MLFVCFLSCLKSEHIKTKQNKKSEHIAIRGLLTLLLPVIPSVMVRMFFITSKIRVVV